MGFKVRIVRQQVRCHVHGAAEEGWDKGFWIGSTYDRKEHTWQGKIDNVFVYARSLSSQEIATIARILPGPDFRIE